MPLSLIGTFAVLYELNYSLDNLSLMGLTIAVGFVVDDAVVVIENIVRHLEAGLTPDGGGAQGLRRNRLHHPVDHAVADRGVHPAVSDERLCRNAVPANSPSRSASSLVLSLVISLTLTPMMCSRLLKPETKRAWTALPAVRARLRWLLAIYERGLKVALRHRFITLMVMFGTIALTGYLYYVIPKGFFPQQDTGMILGIAEAGQDISFQAMAQRMRGRGQGRAGGSGRRFGRRPDRPGRLDRHASTKAASSLR